MADPAIGIMTAIGGAAPILMLFFFLFIPAFLVVGGIVLYFIVLKFEAYAEIQFGYETKDDVKTFPMRYSKDRNFLRERVAIPLSKGKIGIPIPISSPPIHKKGKPLYRFYSPEPGVYIPMNLALDREILIAFEADEDGKQKKGKDGKPIPIYQRVADLIPKVGFDAKQAYAESYAEADKIFKERSKILQLLAQWGPIIIMTVLMLIIIIQLSMLAANLTDGIGITITAEQLIEAGGTVTKTAPFFK